MKIIKTERIKLEDNEDSAWDNMKSILASLANNSDDIDIRNLADTAFKVLSELEEYLIS